MTGLFYVNANQADSIYDLYDGTDNPQGWGGNDRGGWSEARSRLIDYQTGKIKWSHKWESGKTLRVLLSTAGNLISHRRAELVTHRSSQRDHRRTTLAFASGSRCTRLLPQRGKPGWQLLYLLVGKRADARTRSTCWQNNI